MRAAIILVLAILASGSAQTAQDQNSTTCEWHLKNRPKLDGKIVGLFLGQEPKEIEEMYLWLDRYCLDHPKDHLAGAMRKFFTESKLR